MKTTSYEISRKLWEIGFKGEAKGIIFESGKILRNAATAESIKDEEGVFVTQLIKREKAFPYYDLETILEALPVSTDHKGFATNLVMSKRVFGYTINFTDRLPEWIFCEAQQENESLADTTARLLIKLVEAGIVKFNN